MSLSKVLVLIIYFVTFGFSQTTINWLNDPKMRTSRYTVLMNEYCLRCTKQNFVVPYSYGLSNTRQIFSVTGLDFGLGSASFAFKIQPYNLTLSQYEFRVKIMNETVLYRLNVDVLTIAGDVDQYYSEAGELVCKRLNQGQGYRSQNYSIAILTNRPYYNFDAGSISLNHYLSSISLFNPSGHYLYLNWRQFINKTHYTILFQTKELNLIESISFNIIAFDNNYIKSTNYQRIVSIGVISCPSATCLGTGGWVASWRFLDVNRHFWGVSGFNLSKGEEIRWYLNTTSVTDFTVGYIQSTGIKSIQISGMIVVYRQCVDINSALRQYLNPANLQCVNTCPASYPYPNIPNNICSRCHYSCMSCNNYSESSCTSCFTSGHFRIDSGTGAYKCLCKSGYVDVGVAICKKCEVLMPGCATCSKFNQCDSCKSGLNVNQQSDGCQCFNSSLSLTRSGECIDLKGCMTYFNDTNGSMLCIQCDINSNFYLKQFKCSCKTGFKQQFSSALKSWVCVSHCGDGLIKDNEQCDDFNIIDGDGCSANCKIQEGYRCFDGIKDGSFCLKNWAKLTYYHSLKNLDEDNSVDLYFSFQPYDQKIIENGQIFKNLLSTTLSKDSKFTNLEYIFYPNPQQGYIRLIITVVYNKQVNMQPNHVLKFEITDNSTSTESINSTAKFTLQSKNYILNLHEGSDSLARILSCVLLGCIIASYLIFFISIFSENWIGIQLMITLQFLYFYLMLLNKVQQSLDPILKVMKIATGFNIQLTVFDIYEDYQYNDLLYLFGYGKQFISNLNYSALLFTLPILLITIKKILSLILSQKTKKAESLKSLPKVNKKSNFQKIQTFSQKIYKSKYFTSQFIIGKICFSICCINLLQVIFSLYIQESYENSVNQKLNSIGFRLFMYFIVIIQLSLIMWIIIEKFLSQKNPLEDGIFRFKNFEGSYPVFYITFNLVKLLSFIYFFEKQEGIWIMLGFDVFQMIIFSVWRPYFSQKKKKQNKRYILHNLNNIWNCIGLISFLIVIFCYNQQKVSDIRHFSLILIIFLLVFCLTTITISLLRIFSKMKIFQKCRKEQDLSEISINCENIELIQKLKNEQMTRKHQDDVQMKKKYVKRQTKSFKKKSSENGKISNRLN